MDYTRRDAERDTEKALNYNFITKYQETLYRLEHAAQHGETSLFVKANNEEEAWELLGGLRERDFDIYVFDGSKFVDYDELLLYNNNKIFKDDYRMIVRWDFET